MDLDSPFFSMVDDDLGWKHSHNIPHTSWLDTQILKWYFSSITDKWWSPGNLTRTVWFDAVLMIPKEPI